jgi:hypothetical protein
LTAVPSVADKLAMLEKIPEKQTDKGGSKVPIVAISAELDAALKEIAQLKAVMKDAEGYLALKVAEVMPEAERLRRELSIREQRHLTAISLGGGTNLICQNKYPCIGDSERERLQKMFNGRFQELFKTETVLSVDVNKLSEDTIQLLLRDGAAERKTFLKPTEVFHFARSTDSNIAALADRAGIKPVSFLKS